MAKKLAERIERFLNPTGRSYRPSAGEWIEEARALLNEATCELQRKDLLIERNKK